MSVAGLKKQFHKATQRVSEKVGGAEGTKLDDDFKEMEKRVDVTSRAVIEIMTKTTEYLQPNPGQALMDAGETMKQLAEVKDALDMEVKQNFIDPLQNLHDKDLKEIQRYSLVTGFSSPQAHVAQVHQYSRPHTFYVMVVQPPLKSYYQEQHHLKKLEGRRLDFDYKKKRQGKITDDEIRQALEKFDESKEIAESSMFNLLESDIEQVNQLTALVQAQLEYHRQATEIYQALSVQLEQRMKEATARPRREYKPKPRLTYDFGEDVQPNGGVTHSGQKTPGTPLDQPCCRAAYDFEPENEGELGFKEGDVITLTNQIDDNWYEGMLHGQSGFFPINYVQVLVPLPH
ncbi:endophilin-A1-like isoform X3 [Narcine bancroftii]|uniref:endophilin-A1-like isoform X3 n=1 Tax=Narcine bancroftii TaxID=1343680 RepID=UPI00383145A1